MKATIKNLPNYPLKKWIVARYDLENNELWFYGTWDNHEEAIRVATEIGNGIVIERNGE